MSWYFDGYNDYVSDSRYRKPEVCKCDHCEVRLDEDELFEIDSYLLCMDCKAEYIRSKDED